MVLSTNETVQQKEVQKTIYTIECLILLLSNKGGNVSYGNETLFLFFRKTSN